MAQIRVGDVTFGLGADTRGLEKARSAMQSFGREVDRIAQTQTNSSNAVVGAYAKQEAAMRRALNTTVQLQRQLREAGAPAHLIGQTTNSLNALTRALSSGNLNASEYSRAMDRFKVSTDKVKLAMKAIEPPTEKVRSFTSVLRDLQSTTVLAAGPLSGIGTRISAFSAITNRSTLALAGFISGITAVGVGFYKLSAAAVRSAIDIQRIESALMASSGTATNTAHELGYVVDVSKRLGLELTSTAQAYSQFAAATKGTVIEGKAAKEIFEGTATAAAALKLSAADTEGVFRALTQMMSKGTVQAEELRGQLGDRIPGAFRDAAAAMGVSERALSDLMKKGEVLSADLLPKLAARWQEVYGDAAQKSANGLQASMNRAATSQTLFNVAFDETFGISKRVAQVMGLYSQILDGYTNIMNNTAEAEAKRAKQVKEDTEKFIEDQKKAQDASTDRVSAYITDVGKMLQATRIQTIALREELAEQQRILDGAYRPSSARGSRANPGSTPYAKDKAVEIEAEIKANDELIKKYQDQLKQLNGMWDKAGETTNGSGSSGSGADSSGSGSKAPKLNKMEEVNDTLEVMKKRIEDINALPDYWMGGTESLERYNKALDRGKQLEAFRDKLILAGASVETINQKMKEFQDLMDANDAAEERMKKIEERAKALDEVGGNALDHLGTFLEDLNDGTKSLAESWSDMVDSIIKDLRRWAIEQQVIQPLKDLLAGSGSSSSGGGWLSGIVGGIGDALGSFFGGGSSVSQNYLEVFNDPYLTYALPGRARGGAVSANKPYMVGENGPEPFIPNSSGKIMPNDFMGSNVQVMVNINNNTGSKVSATQSSDGRSIDISIDEAVAKQIGSMGTRSNKAVRNAGNRLAGR